MKILKIGRDMSCDIVLHSERVSSLHAEITLLNSGDMVLEDKGSHNGTFVMNQKVRPGSQVKINRGDAIRFADVELQWSQIPMPEDNSMYRAIYGIGSHVDNDIRVTGSTVSRYHATIKVGRDNKVYIVDHSKNGTTVNGQKIPANSPVLINSKSAIVCGGVPVNLNNGIVPFPKSNMKRILAFAASLLIVAGLGVAAYFLVFNKKGGDEGPWGQEKTARVYCPTTALLIGMYHFEVECGDLDPHILNRIGIPTKFYYTITSTGKKILVPYSHDTNLSDVDAPTYEGTGFFISNDGEIMTNLHVVKPWLFDGMLEQVQSECVEMLTELAETTTGKYLLNGQTYGLSAYIHQLKVKGVSDGIIMIPQGSYFSRENAISCHILTCGDSDPKEDVAIIKVDKNINVKKDLNCSYVNLKTNFDSDEKTLKMGGVMYTIGFPYGTSLQKLDSESGLQSVCLSGHITQIFSDNNNFTFDATSYHGASGSPIFNDYGQLIGVLCEGFEKGNFNRGVRASVVKKLLNSPHKK